MKWSNLAKCPSLKNLTDGGFGVLKESQHAAVQDLTKAHIEPFDQAVTDGLSRVVQVSNTSYKLQKYKTDTDDVTNICIHCALDLTNKKLNI